MQQYYSCTVYQQNWGLGGGDEITSTLFKSLGSVEISNSKRHKRSFEFNCRSSLQGKDLTHRMISGSLNN